MNPTTTENKDIQNTTSTKSKTETTKTAEVSAPKEKQPATVDIVCVDCGATRTIARQEAFQVKRCIACQEKYRKAQRKGYRKNRMLNLRTRIQLLENLLLTNNISIPA